MKGWRREGGSSRGREGKQWLCLKHATGRSCTGLLPYQASALSLSSHGPLIPLLFPTDIFTMATQAQALIAFSSALHQAVWLAAGKKSLHTKAAVINDQD